MPFEDRFKSASIEPLEKRMLLATVIGGRANPDPLDEAISFRLPLSSDTTTHYYFDRDPAAGVDRAWNNSTTAVYDGHTGSDFSGGPRGRPIYAAADGILIARVDGFGDQEGTANGNYIKLNHGNDRNGIPINTLYLHMNAGTPINLPLGTFIAAGTEIGGVGTSGNSTGLHLHFHLQYNTTATDPFAATGSSESSWWANQGSGSPSTATPAKKFVVGDFVEVFSASVSVRSPNAESAIIGSQAVGATGQVIQGAVLSSTDGNNTNNVYTRYKVQFTNGMIGWVAQNWLKKAGTQEITVTQGATAITDGQANAYDFGSVEKRKPGITRIFTVTNTGSQALTLGSVSFPTGWTVTDNLVSSLAPGASDTFTIRLDNLVVGTKNGTLSFATNDPDENPFNFPITGVVTPDVTAPTVDVVDVTPDPLSAPLSSISIVFSEPVSNFDKNDLTLTRNGETVSLAAATLTTSNNTTFTLANLEPASAASGTYTLTVLSGGLTDDSSNTLATGASDTVKVQTSLFRGDATGSTADAYYLRKSTDGTKLEIFENVSPGPTPTYTLTFAGLMSLTFDTLGGDNIITVDYSRGDPLPVGSNGFSYLAGNGNNSLSLSGAGTFTFYADAMTTTPNLSVSSTTTNISFTATQHLKALSLNSAIATLHPGVEKVLVVDSISTTGGKLDLTTNDMIVRNMSRSAVEALVKAGFGNFDWLGTGITSSFAATFAQSDGSRAVGVIDNGDWGYGTFNGQTVGGSDVLVKYTWTGDLNLDGFVNNDDFGQFLYGFNGGGSPTWLNGDLNFDGLVDNDDMGLFLAGLNAFNASGGMQL